MSSSEENVIYFDFKQRTKLESPGGFETEPERAETVETEQQQVVQSAAINYSRKDVCDVLKIKPSTLKAWENHGLINHQDQGYTFSDLLSIRVAKELSQAGIKPSKVKHALEQMNHLLPKSTRPLLDLRVTSDGEHIYIRDQDHDMDAQSGQLLFDFGVRGFQEEVVAEIKPKIVREKHARKLACEAFLKAAEAEQYDLQQAMVGYKKAIELDPTFAHPWVNLGNIAFRFGDLSVAKDHYKRAIEKDKQQAEAHHNLGVIALEEHQLLAASTSFEAAIDADPAFAEAYYNWGITLERLGEDPRNAFAVFLELSPEGIYADAARKRLMQPD